MGSKTTRTIITVGLAIILIAGSAVGYYFYDKKSKEVDALTAHKSNLERNMEYRDSVIHDMLNTFEQVEKDISIVKQKHNIISLNSEDPEMSNSRKEGIIRDIQMMNTMLEKSKNRVNELEKKLRNSGIKIGALNNKINSLNRLLEGKDADIAQLKTVLQEKDFKIDELNKTVTNLEEDVAVKEIVIDKQEEELNKAYFAYGTYQDLKEKGVITKDGGFFWIGQNKTLTKNISEENFTRIDITQVDTIDIQTKKAELITTHPAGSFSFAENENGEITSFIINDPVEFWRVSKYAVLEVK